MEIQRKSNKHSSWIVYTLLWPVLMIIQSLIVGGSAADVPFFWQRPNLYYSLWIMDLFLIALWYANYYLLAPRMMRKRMFGAYITVVVLMMLIGLFLQLLLNAIFGWCSPMSPYKGTVSIFGCLGALSLMALGLSIRGVMGWLKNEKELKALHTEKDGLELRIKQLEEKLSYYDYKELPVNEDAEQVTPQQLPDFSQVSGAEYEGVEPFTEQDDLLDESDPL